ncbi:MAG: nickel-dependent lactate racemase [Acidobacteriota bacterium]
MLVKLAYGKHGLPVDFPEDRTTVIEPQYVAGVPDEREALLRALREPMESPPLRSLVSSGQSVAISVCDLTRPMPSSRVLPVLLNQLDHVPKERITILVATGTHRTNTVEELEGMLGREVVSNYRVVNHISTDQSSLQHVGQTAGGIPVWINRTWLESDIRIATGFVEPHFFAGFSGGPKMVAPGLAGLETVMHLHGARLLSHPESTWGITEGNPIHDAIREIARRTGVSFSLDVTINREHQITGVFAGELFAVHAAACRFGKETAMRPVKEPFEIVVTTNSGYPLDLNLYQAVKGMSAAARVVSPGGTIICAAECRDGIPEHGDYGNILASAGGPEEILQMIHSPGYARRDQWQAQLQAQIQLKARVSLKSTGLSDEQIRQAHLDPLDDIAAGISELNTRARICVLPQGPQTIPYLERAPSVD